MPSPPVLPVIASSRAAARSRSPFRVAARNRPIRCPGGPVIPVGGAAQHRAARRPRRRVQRVGRRPRRVRAVVRITGGAAAQVLRRGGGLPGRVPVDLGAFRRSEPERPGTLRRPAARPRAQPCRSRGRVSESCSRPPPYQRGAPSGPVQPGRVTAYPVTSPGLIVAEPFPHQQPGRAQPGEELRLSSRPAPPPQRRWRGARRGPPGPAALPPRPAGHAPAGRPTGRAAWAGSGPPRASRRRTR